MNTSKHTAAPWTHQVMGGPVREGVRLGEDGWADVRGKNRHNNARLIAKAPAYEDALRAILGLAEQGQEEGRNPVAYLDGIEAAARAALEKAGAA